MSFWEFIKRNVEDERSYYVGLEESSKEKKFFLDLAALIRAKIGDELTPNHPWYSFWCDFADSMTILGRFVLPSGAIFKSIIWRRLSFDGNKEIIDYIRENFGDAMGFSKVEDIFPFLLSIKPLQRDHILHEAVNNHLVERKLKECITNNSEATFINILESQSDSTIIKKLVFYNSIYDYTHSGMLEEYPFSSNEGEAINFAHDTAIDSFEQLMRNKSDAIDLAHDTMDFLVPFFSRVYSSFEERPAQNHKRAEFFVVGVQKILEYLFLLENDLESIDINKEDKYLFRNWKTLFSWAATRTLGATWSIAKNKELTIVSKSAEKWEEVLRDNPEEWKRVEKLIYMTSPREEVSTETSTAIETSNIEVGCIDPNDYRFDVDLKERLSTPESKYEVPEGLIEFINGIAQKGYIDDNIETKELFYVRFTGKAKYEGYHNEQKIVWKERPKLLYYFVKEYCKQEDGKYERISDFFEFAKSDEKFFNDIKDANSKKIKNYSYFSNLGKRDASFGQLMDKLKSSSKKTMRLKPDMR